MNQTIVAKHNALFTDVYRWFTEGFDTADRQATKALREALQDSPQQGYHHDPLGRVGPEG